VGVAGEPTGMTAPRSQPRPAPKYYHHSGTHTVTRALPYLLQRIADDGVPDEALTPLEAAARAWRREAEADLGSNLAATARALLDAATGTVILLASLDRYVFELAERGGLVNRTSRRAFSVLDSRMRLADSLARQVQALGLERRTKPSLSLTEYVAAQYGTAGGARSAAPETPAPITHEEDDHESRGDADHDAGHDAH
jgi:hypothetical protein